MRFAGSRPRANWGESGISDRLKAGLARMDRLEETLKGIVES